MDVLPIESLLPALIEALQSGRPAVVTAPPGAGKSTRLPLALLEAGVCPGTIALLQPRRIAARAVARRMASMLGETVGETVGYLVRHETRCSAKTRLLVMTEGVLTRRLLEDPLLEGVGAVLLDEFHERSIHTDLCLAFLKEVREVRPGLALAILSATLDPAPLQAYLEGAVHLESPERSHPLRIEHRGPGARRIEPGRVRGALLELFGREDDDGGDALVFLPGAAEIRKTAAHLAEHPLPGAPAIVPLYGALPPAEQDRALERGERRRVVLATNLAETSLTVPGVTAVVDCGLVKQLRFDPRTGLDRLQQGFVSKASAAQRAGRAGRTGPGRVLRLWGAHEPLPEASPEIARLDLAPTLLAVLAFHPGDPRLFGFFEPPRESALEAGLGLLTQLGLIAAAGSSFALTQRGKALAALPLHPRIGAVLGAAASAGLNADGALLAALLEERDVLHGAPAPAEPTSSDLLLRRERFLALEARGFNAEAARALGLDFRAAREVRTARRQLERLTALLPKGPPMAATESALLRAILAGFPDRVCRRRRPHAPDGVMVGGRGVRIGPGSAVSEAPLFLALDAEAPRRGTHLSALVRKASAVREADLEALFPALLREERLTELDAERLRVRGVARRLFADLVLDERETPADPDQAALLLAELTERHFERAVRIDERARSLIARLRLAAAHLPGPWPALDRAALAALVARADSRARDLEALTRVDLAAALHRSLAPAQARVLRSALPEHLRVPSGREAPIDYAPADLPDGAPVLRVKLQEMFGQRETPSLLQGRLPLVVHLLAPNGRPVQITRDLPSFWENGYPAVRRELRGRYPKHPWPEDPWTAPPTARTKRRS